MVSNPIEETADDRWWSIWQVFAYLLEAAEGKDRRDGHPLGPDFVRDNPSLFLTAESRENFANLRFGEHAKLEWAMTEIVRWLEKECANARIDARGRLGSSSQKSHIIRDTWEDGAVIVTEGEHDCRVCPTRKRRDGVRVLAEDLPDYLDHCYSEVEFFADSVQFAAFGESAPIAQMTTPPKKRRGPAPSKRDAIVADMRRLIARDGREALARMTEKQLAHEYAVSRDTVRQARNIALADPAE